MKKEGMCPFCKSIGKIYGLPYGLQIGSCDVNKQTDLDKVILLSCGECGAVLGIYKKDDTKAK